MITIVSNEKTETKSMGVADLPNWAVIKGKATYSDYIKFGPFLYETKGGLISYRDYIPDDIKHNIDHYYDVFEVDYRNFSVSTQFTEFAGKPIVHPGSTPHLENPGRTLLIVEPNQSTPFTLGIVGSYRAVLVIGHLNDIVLTLHALPEWKNINPSIPTALIYVSIEVNTKEYVT